MKQAIVKAMAAYLEEHDWCVYEDDGTIGDATADILFKAFCAGKKAMWENTFGQETNKCIL